MGTEASEELPLVLRTAPSDAASVVASSDSPNTGASLAGAHAVSVDDPAGAGEYSQVRYLRSSPLRLGLYIALCIATGVVVLPFFARWYPVVFTLIAREEITDAKERRSADYALCWPRKGGKPVECRIQRLRTSPASSLSAHVRAALPMADEFVFFEFRKLRYVYDHALNDYQPLKHALEVDFETLHEKFKNHGLTAQDHQVRAAAFASASHRRAAGIGAACLYEARCLYEALMGSRLSCARAPTATAEAASRQHSSTLPGADESKPAISIHVDSPTLPRLHHRLHRYLLLFARLALSAKEGGENLSMRLPPSAAWVVKC
jgi:hypothetical protein